MRAKHSFAQSVLRPQAPMLSEKQFKCLMANNKLSTIDCGQIAIKKLSSL